MIKQEVRVRIQLDTDWLKFPSRKYTPTGDYAFINNDIYIEIKKSYLFGLLHDTFWLHEMCFEFRDIAIVRRDNED